MSTHYIDITLRPDPEFSPAHLLNALHAQLHLALVQLGTGDVGVSFPGFILRGEHSHLGTTLRLHGATSALQRLQALSWLRGMRDHVKTSEVAPVPTHTQHRVVRRVQAKSSPERSRRRLMRRLEIDEAQALQRIPDQEGRRLALPYLRLQSASKGQVFRLFIEHGPLLDTPSPGSFGTYGLSTQATIPWF
ncbi:type I-F CRISPR-associated endoribonuclease Cas6/Csy4 [Verminephrobacter eiseniae]|uniref:CRISPR-associated protein, Csy4 family n=1 Tax=Verminephrobacter eiseniae (strain EF01-2) TaxID=391735 RepID=A1WHV8_VEREI|nr:type I-F CRISPR-associated endoribonuclease Cas6/Csy4 [Verminephrobacter eiseniae]ABM57215.1 CRISPR-associated protein, Csy4 family [Verminephrobacter eiseniae EF01-2]MCW5282844.1 type I-F CRISPR-associated endoribonuclease Cas6/Csy4 [Verminephrobacter eiseniae]MCW5303160.1 type I-F CRISPR-associated endoribonuclease Cas6/Csy4 [Verminephrobacter eiseniae]MCW8179902.1 type I-F CRISPR-associated endoribonuclease Cas6/Csy4 [Verminephrobacter eiseniae]MCW8189296.1 type I-F CRISPR-associated end